MKAIQRLTPNGVIFFNCDIQTKFKPLIYNSDSVVNVAIMMAKIANIY